MYSFPDLEPVSCCMSSSNCCFLTYIQISQEAGQVVWYSHLLKNFTQFVVIHTVKGFGVVKKQRKIVFWTLAFSIIQWILIIWSLVPLPFLNLAWTSWSSLFMYFKPGLENFDYYFTIMWDECNCVVVWAFFGIAFLLDWNENRPFLVLWPLLSFPTLLVYWVQHFQSIVFQDLKQLNWNSITYTSLFIVMLSMYIYILVFQLSTTVLKHSGLYNNNRFLKFQRSVG